MGGSYSFTVRATDGSGHTGDQAYTLTLLSSWATPLWMSTGWPSCLRMSETGLLSGMPMTLGTWSIWVAVTNRAGSTLTLTYTLVVTT